MSDTLVTRLWEVDHPYYCTEGNFYKNGLHEVFESWADFATHATFERTEFVGNVLYDWDDDYNFLWRWDWKRADPGDYYLQPGDPDDETADYEEARKTDRLLLFFMMQRRGHNASAEVKVTEADEPAVREWLTKKAEYLRTVWEPLL